MVDINQEFVLFVEDRYLLRRALSASMASIVCFFWSNLAICTVECELELCCDVGGGTCLDLGVGNDFVGGGNEEFCMVLCWDGAETHGVNGVSSVGDRVVIVGVSDEKPNCFTLGWWSEPIIVV